jgi:hypothetical protein
MATGASKARVAPALNGPGGGGFPVRVQKKPKEDSDFLKINSLTFPHDVGKYYLNIQISDYLRETRLYGTADVRPGAVIMNLKNNIVMPIPLQMIDHHHVTYSEEDLGLIKGGLTSQSSGNFWDGVLSTLAGTAIRASDFLGFGPITQSQFGAAPNEFLTVLLKGPAYKQYQFSWRMAPKTPEESETIRSIIATLNQNMAPKPGGAIWRYPSVFKVSISPNERFMYGFKPAVLEDLQANYTPDGVGAFKAGTGAPAAVELTLSFKEIEFWSPEDFSP